MRTIHRTLVAVTAAIVSFAAARDAAACFDGYVATIGKVDIQRALGDVSWSPERAREVARWGARIDALVPAGAHLDVTTVEACCRSESGTCGGVQCIATGSDDLPALFRALAVASGAGAAQVRAARALEPKLYTVQIFAGSARGAAAVKKRVADLDAGTHGFFEAGGFPASNETAHVLHESAAGAQHRVVVGAFLSQKDAEAARAALRAQGLRGFTRELPAGRPVGERVWSMGE